MSRARLAWNSEPRSAMLKVSSINMGNNGPQSPRHNPLESPSNGNSMYSSMGSLKASNRMAACPSKLASILKPVKAAAASNNRPTELETGQWSWRSQAWTNNSVSFGQDFHAMPISRQRANPQRQGSRLALSPPSKRKGRIEETLRQVPGCPNKASPPQSV